MSGRQAKAGPLAGVIPIDLPFITVKRILFTKHLCTDARELLSIDVYKIHLLIKAVAETKVSVTKTTQAQNSNEFVFWFWFWLRFRIRFRFSFALGFWVCAHFF